MRLAGGGEFAQGDAALALQADVDDGLVVLDRGDGALDDASLKAAVGTAAKRFIEHRGEIVAGGIGE